MKKTITITILFCTAGILSISGCSQVEQNRSNNSVTEKQIQKQITNFDNNDLNADYIPPKPPSQKLLSIFEGENFINSNAECSLSCLRKLLFFEDFNYATDGKNIYVNVLSGGESSHADYQIMKNVNIDINSFKPLNKRIGYSNYFKDTHYFKDKNQVYFDTLSAYENKDELYFDTLSAYENLNTNIKILKNIDPKTVKVISTHCLADKNAVYCDMPYMYSNKEIEMKKVEGADLNSFVLEKKAMYETVFFDSNNRFENVSDKGIDIQMVRVLNNEPSDPNATVVVGAYNYYLKAENSSAPYKNTALNRVCFEPAQMETFNDGNLFCFSNTKEALSILGINEIDNTCKKYWGVGTVEVKGLTNKNLTYNKGDPCVSNGNCDFNEAELVNVIEFFKGKLPKCEK